ncbi:MAG: transpeptidase family protein [Tannerella sp.]|jgi:cell division protein FtsI (penicillin-binding protein 3)|nr:transpeptidase family protein [Tannerella sp.]
MPKNEKNTETSSGSNQIQTRYFLIILLLLCPLIIGIVAFTIKIAFVQKDQWAQLAKQSERKPDLLFPNRGNIYSSDGKLMATTVSRYYTYIDFKADGFPVDTFRSSKQNGVDSLAYYLSKKFKNRSAESYKSYLLKGLKSKSREYPVYEGRVSYMDLKEMKQFPFFKLGRNVSGFYDKVRVQRHKLYGSLASRTIGDIFGETDSIGISKGRVGLEAQYDSLLRGLPGMNSYLRVGKKWQDVIAEEPVNGMDLITTIDVKIQDLTEKALVDKLKEIDAETGVAIVMEVRTGEIKAISNMDRIRPGVYAEITNHAVADEMEPGSTFKIASMMVAIEDKVCTPDEPVDVGNGLYFYAGGKPIRDHNADKGGYHLISAEKAIWFSSNVGVAKLILKGYEHNPGKFVEGLHRIGIDEKFDLEIPGAGAVHVRTPEDRYWSKKSLPWMSFGYEVQSPPIHTLTFYNAIANNGKMIRPIFTKEIRQNGKIIHRNSTDVIRPSICSNETLGIIRQMLTDVVEKGTGNAVHSDVVSIAGKTGTAQIATGGSYQSHQVSFCGYFPAENPQYSCIVMIRRPRIGYPSGGTMSGGVFKVIAEKLYSRQVQFDLRHIEGDSARVMLPAVRNSDTKALEYVLDELDIDTKPGRLKSGYAIGERTKGTDFMEIKPLTVKEGLVPHVVGMGAKDAVYALENCGLRVKFAGHGQVVSQSIPAGQKAVKGQTVAIVLKN